MAAEAERMEEAAGLLNPTVKAKSERRRKIVVEEEEAAAAKGAARAAAWAVVDAAGGYGNLSEGSGEEEEKHELTQELEDDQKDMHWALRPTTAETRGGSSPRVRPDPRVPPPRAAAANNLLRRAMRWHPLEMLRADIAEAQHADTRVVSEAMERLIQLATEALTEACRRRQLGPLCLCLVEAEEEGLVDARLLQKVRIRPTRCDFPIRLPENSFFFNPPPRRGSSWRSWSCTRPGVLRPRPSKPTRSTNSDSQTGSCKCWPCS